MSSEQRCAPKFMKKAFWESGTLDSKQDRRDAAMKRKQDELSKKKQPPKNKEKDTDPVIQIYSF